MGMKIDGTALAAKHTENLKQQLQSLHPTRQPTIVSFCNEEDPPSVKYTEMKFQKAEEVGIIFKKEMYNKTTPEIELSEKLTQYNDDPEVDGIMVQLPVPLDLVVFQKDLLQRINPQKDVDGLTEAGQQLFMPATVKSVISLLDEEVENWQSREIGVIGAMGEIGKPLVRILRDKGVQSIVEIDLAHGDLANDLRDCDIVISTTGKEGLIKAEMVREGVVAIDVGLGDLDPAVYEKASKYTGRIGGVGPMTVVSLMENVVESYRNERH